MKNALESAVKLLSSRAHAKEELRKKLVAKKFPEEEARRAVDECERLGFLNDSDFAESMTGEMLRRGCGSRKISQTLLRRGVGRETAKAAMKDVPGRDGNPDEFEAALEALKRKKKTFERETDPRKRKLKAMRFLAGRGFGSEIVMRAVSKSLNETLDEE